MIYRVNTELLKSIRIHYEMWVLTAKSTGSVMLFMSCYTFIFQAWKSSDFFNEIEIQHSHRKKINIEFTLVS